MAQVNVVAGITGSQDLSGLRDAEVLQSGPTILELKLGPNASFVFTGTGFTFDGDGNFTAGTVTKTEIIASDPENIASKFVIYSATGLTASAAQAVGFIQANDSDGYTSLLFGGADTVTGNGEDDYLNGYGGNDSILGANGHDNMFGGDGSDTLRGGAGNDHLYGLSATGGADGADTVNGDEGNDYIQGNAGDDFLNGGEGSDRINGGADNDEINGGEGNDTVNGNKGQDTIDGGEGNDSLRGGAGDDSIEAGDGNDVLLGDLGNDTLYGDAGLDIITGGAGGDLFAFDSGDASFTTIGALAYVTDTITDFENGQDKLDIGFNVEDVADAPAAFASVQAAFAYSQNEFATADQPAVSVVEAQVGADTYIFYSSHGNAEVDSAIRLVNFQAANFDTDDFVSAI